MKKQKKSARSKVDSPRVFQARIRSFTSGLDAECDFEADSRVEAAGNVRTFARLQRAQGDKSWYTYSDSGVGLATVYSVYRVGYPS